MGRRLNEEIKLSKEEMLWKSLFGAAVKLDQTTRFVVETFPDDKDVHFSLEKMHIIFQILLSNLVQSKRIVRPLPIPGEPNGKHC